MDAREVREIALAAAHEAVKEVLSNYGIGPDPKDAQADMAYLRAQRIISSKIGIGLRLAIIGALVSGALAVLWLGIKAVIKSGL